VSYIEKTRHSFLTFNFKAMKNILIRSTAIAVVLFASSFSFAGSNVANEFEITPVEDLYLGNSIEKVWKINYSESETPVTIALRSVGDEKEFIVRTQFIEVLYVKNNKGFGVRKMPASMKEIPGRITSSVIDKKQMQQQQILTPNNISDAFALELIASYLPDLIKNEYKQLIY